MRTKGILIGWVATLLLSFNVSAQTVFFDDFSGTPSPASPYFLDTLGNFEQSVVSGAGYTYGVYINPTGGVQEWNIGIASGALQFTSPNAGLIAYGGVFFTFAMPDWTVGAVTGEDIQKLKATFNFTQLTTAPAFVRIYAANGDWYNTTYRFEDYAPTLGSAADFVLDASTLSLEDAANIASMFNARNITTVKVEIALGFSTGPYEFHFNSLHVESIPEPATGIMLGAGAILLAGCAWFRRRG